MVPSAHSEGRRSEGLQDGVGIPAPHARAAKDPGHGAGAESAGPVRRRGEIPEFPEPGPREIVLQIEELRVVPPELRADPVDQARAPGGPLAGPARPFPQPDDGRRDRIEKAKGRTVGTQGSGPNPGLAAASAAIARVNGAGADQKS